jgi:hypothetical protein
MDFLEIWNSYIVPATPLLIVLIGLVLFLTGKITKLDTPLLKLEGAKAKAKINSMAQSPDVRIYTRLWDLIKQHIIDDIRYRIEKNGWAKIKDWSQYKEDAFKAHDLLRTEYLDDNYLDNLKIERIELYEHDKQIEPEVKGIYDRLYDNMLNYSKEAKQDADKIKKEIDELDAQPNTKASDVWILLKQLTEIERINLKERCLTEAERFLTEIARRYISHYLTLYKRKDTK